MIWKTSLEWIFKLKDVAIYNIIYSTRMHGMLQSKIVMEDKKVEEEYVPGSSICVIFVKKEVKLITFLDCKMESG